MLHTAENNLDSIELTPLCVDLDGTLVKSDTLVDSLFVFLRQRPGSAFSLLAALAHGKAGFKAYVTGKVELDVVHLPYNRELLTYLQHEHERGRKIYLATGADQRLAERVARHLGIFAGVFGSDGATNLTGKNKLERLRNFIGSDQFGYIGNARADLPLLKASSEALVANPTLGLKLGIKSQGIKVTHSFHDASSPVRCLFKALRLHQWAKNLLIFLPLFLAHKAGMPKAMASLLAFVCFGMTASATYIINDLLDIEADRRHPRKRRRAFASGDMSAFVGLAISASFLIAAFVAGALLLPHAFLLWLGLYLVTTLSYTAILKRLALLDVLVLSGLYTLRLQVGGAATGTPISHWLAGFSVFLFLSLAFVKRFAELENLRASGATPKNGRGYLVADLEQLRAFGTASAFAAVVVFANYISGSDVMALYHKPSMLWLVVPMMLLWLCRVWLLAARGELNEDPVVFALTDKLSLLIGGIVVLLALMAL